MCHPLFTACGKFLDSRGRQWTAALIIVGLLVPMAATQLAPAAEKAAGAAAAEEEAEKHSPFIRFDSSPDGGGVLQTSIVPYVNDEGVRVDLIGAVHVGDHAYYELLNERFRAYDSLLYEMVKPRDADAARRETHPGLGLIGVLQEAMKTVLELDHQLEDIDYRAENFVHADMDLQTFMRRQEEQGEGFLELMLRQMLRDMTRPADPEHQPPSMVEILDALSAPDRARQLKLLFARELSRPEQMMELFGEASVILNERNEAAFEVLDERIEAGDRRLGIFYGAAHLPDMESLLEERGFRRAGEIEWLTAWDMTLDGSGREQMKQRLRDRIVASAAEREAAGTAGRGEVEADPDEDARLRKLREENEALREQIEALRAQLDAIREQLDPDRQ